MPSFAGPIPGDIKHLLGVRLADPAFDSPPISFEDAAMPQHQPEQAEELNARVGVDDLVSIGKILEEAGVKVVASDSKRPAAMDVSDASGTLGTHTARDSLIQTSNAQLDLVSPTSSMKTAKKRGRPPKYTTEQERRAAKKAEGKRTREMIKTRLKSDKAEDIIWAVAYREKRKKWEKTYKVKVRHSTSRAKSKES